jgi:hypothetical protein
MIPATCLLSRRRNEGPNWVNVTVEVAVPSEVVTTTGTVPVAVSSGVCKLIWVGLASDRYADFRLIVTLVRPSDNGKFPVQTTVELARFVP